MVLDMSPKGKMDWTDLVTVLVGKNEKKFLVYREAIKVIPFFEGCLNSPMKEAQESVVKLPEDDPEAFEELIFFMYYGKFKVDLKELGNGKLRAKNSSTDFGNDVRRRCRTWILADKLLAETAANAAIDSLRDHLRRFDANATTLRLVLQYASRGSAILRLVSQRFSRSVKKAGGWEKWKAEKRLGTSYSVKSLLKEWSFVSKHLQTILMVFRCPVPKTSASGISITSHQSVLEQLLRWSQLDERDTLQPGLHNS